jgi:hypothetical protein
VGFGQPLLQQYEPDCVEMLGQVLGGQTGHDLRRARLQPASTSSGERLQARV